MQNGSQMWASAQRIFDGVDKNPPRNEQETLQRVVLPLLRELAGYDPENDFHYEHTSLAGRADIYYPTQAAQDALWIEVKDWNTPLEDKHAVQLVNYVNTQGGRWGVLTNGQEWRLYDCHLMHLCAQDRLVLQADRDNLQSVIEFMRVVSKTAIDTQQVEVLLRPSRLANLLEALVIKPSPNHPLFHILRNALQKDFPNLSDGELSDALCEVVKRITQSAIATSTPSPVATAQTATPPPISSFVFSPPSASHGSNKSLLNNQYRNWKQAYIGIVKYCHSVDAQKTEEYLINRSNRRKLYDCEYIGESGSVLTTPLGNGKHFYTNLATWEICRRLRELASLFGLSGKQIEVKGQVFTL